MNEKEHIAALEHIISSGLVDRWTRILLRDIIAAYKMTPEQKQWFFEAAKAIKVK